MNWETLAYLADFVGQRLNPNPETNPFGGFTTSTFEAKKMAEFMKQFKQPEAPAAGGAPAGAGGGAPAAPAPKTESPLAPPNPFGPEYAPPAPGTGYPFDQMPEVTPEHESAVESGVNDLFARAMEPNIETKIDKDNNFVFTERRPAQQQAGMPTSKKKPPESVTNPFWTRG